MSIKQITTDVCIVGAGPGGAYASLILGKKNIPHVLLDAATFPRHKACADLITSWALKRLNEIDPEIIGDLKKRKEILPLYGTTIYPPNGLSFNLNFQRFGTGPDAHSTYTSSRYHFDGMLVRKAQENKNATVMQCCRAKQVLQHSDCIEIITENDISIKAKMLIVATGSSNNITKQLNLEYPKKLIAVGIRAYYQDVVCDPLYGEVFLDKRTLPGAIYIAPLPENTYNLNMVILIEKVNRDKINLQKMLESILASHPVLKPKFEKAKRISNFQGSGLFLGLQKRVLTGDRFILVGDSAGLIDYITGNGIPQAMVSAKIAALKTIEALEANNFSKKFLRSYETELYKKYTESRIIGSLARVFLNTDIGQRTFLGFMSRIASRPEAKHVMEDIFNRKHAILKFLNPFFLYRILLK